MQIQIYTDHNLREHKAPADSVHASVKHALGRFSEHITRIEVHLADENAGKGGRDDKRCMIEARVEGRHPVAVTHYASTVGQAIDGAAEKMSHLLEHTLGRQRNHRSHAAVPIPTDLDLEVPPTAQ